MEEELRQKDGLTKPQEGPIVNPALASHGSPWSLFAPRGLGSRGFLFFVAGEQAIPDLRGVGEEG